MTHDELREALAERLCNVTMPRTGDRTPWEEAKNHSTKEFFRRIADECIRQMEWARKQPLDALSIVQGADEHGGQYDGCSLCHYHKDWETGRERWKHLDHLAKHEPDCPTGQALSAPLSLAPEGWKP